LISITATVFIVILASKIASGFTRDLRRDVFKKVQSFSNAEFDKFSTGSLITRTTNDIGNLQSLLFLFVKNTIYSLLFIIFGPIYVYKILNVNISLIFILSMGIAFMAIAAVVIFFTVSPKIFRIQKLLDKLNNIMRERLGGLLVIKANDNEKYEESRYEDVNLKIKKNNLFVNRIIAVVQPAMVLVMNILGVAIVLYTISEDLLANGSLLPGTLLAFLQYTIQIIMAFLFTSATIIFLPRAIAAIKRISEILAVQPSVTDAENPIEPKGDRFNFKFENVGFAYEKNSSVQALKNLSFEAEAGMTTAIVGATGSGKTTLINLILRFYDPTEGAIYINGINVRDIPQETLRKNIGYVPQHPMLFSGTIGENLLASNPDASVADMDRAIEVAKAEDFVSAKGQSEELADKYDVAISQAGKNISGGQKQRLSIARAVVRNPKWYILDDSFSALDYVTEANLRAELLRETRQNGAGVIIVSQRIASVLNADNIIVLNDGRISGQGTHAELMTTCPEYRKIAESQLPKEETEIFADANGGL
ncbi:MAG: ABC transporter ATP-binding protein/permease, partial [Clostridiales bacterium]|jgi:ATP-binding cassette subfamily B protein|nr:ABC transporter ATP-binding protein/permease [Clostridiales bacterium]